MSILVSNNFFINLPRFCISDTISCLRNREIGFAHQRRQKQHAGRPRAPSGAVPGMPPVQPGYPGQHKHQGQGSRHADAEKGLHRIPHQSRGHRRAGAQSAPDRRRQKATPARKATTPPHTRCCKNSLWTESKVSPLRRIMYRMDSMSGASRAETASPPRPKSIWGRLRSWV